MTTQPDTDENQDLRQRVRLQVNRGLRQTFRAYNPGQEMPPETLRAMTNRVSDAVLDALDLACSTCGGDGSGLTPENDGRGAQCPSCLTWNIDFCPNCGDEFEAPCIRHTNTEHY